MKTLNSAAFGILLSAFSTAPAMALDANNQITQISPSIIMIGIADPCANGACDEEIAAIEAKGDRNAPLVNANGMPTGEAIIMRPSVETTAVQATVKPATITEAPVAAEAPAATGAEPPVIAADASPAQPEVKPANGEVPKSEGQLN